ncbi:MULTISPECIES: DegV family protein [Actinopolyspora]|uniref:DegV family protein n=1 Tax=Actinopolyspora TaxID=1849 RepID=UPI0013F670DC|nr:DegV family protein [Actinopolyspora saharensis]NHD17207.1 DegV family protein [Actinopolyspora sp. BKK2]NHE76359.1 DegV family protein [Actinopolyspora sp. BKK1]
MQHVAIVTDSTASLPQDLAAHWGISVASMQLRVGDELTREPRVSTDWLLRAMRNGVPVEAKAPAPDTLLQAYQQAWHDSATAVVSLHVSSRLSPATQAALQASTHVPTPVHIVDSQSSGMALGFAALAGARTAAAGGSPAEVCATAQRRAARTQVIIYIDDLEYLHRAGYIGKTAAYFGSKMAVKPLLTVRDGEVEPMDKLLGSERAVGKAVDRAVELAGEDPVDVAVEHFAAPNDAEELMTALKRKIPRGEEFVRTRVSTAIGANVGPGALAVTISPH